MKKFKNSTIEKFENKQVSKMNAIFGGEVEAAGTTTAKNQTRENIIDKDKNDECNCETK